MPLRAGRDRLAEHLRRLFNVVEQENAVLPDYLSRPFAIAAAHAWLDDHHGLQSEHDLHNVIERVTRYRELIPPMLAEHERAQHRQ